MMRRIATSLVLACLLLQAAIPVGYMPASLSSGSFVQLCPDGLPPSFVHKLAGGHHHHQHADSEASFERCELAPGAIVTAAPGAHPAPARLAVLATASAQPRSLLVRESIRDAYRPRSPPFSGQA